MSGQDEELR
jgi:hypothetical protein